MKGQKWKGKVYSYMRWSSEPQSWGDSERRQEQQAKNWCLCNGRMLANQTFTDRGVSGWHGNNRREGALGALLKVVKDGDTILIEDTDRWSRERPLDALNALRDTVNRGVEIVFLKTGVIVNRDNFDDPGVLFPNFFGSFLANAENEKRSYRIKQAMQARREQVKSGKAVQGRLPAWLQWDRQLGRPVIIEEKAVLVRKIFALCLEGRGVRAVERILRNCPPIANSKQANWNTRFIHRLLKDKAAIGWHVPTNTAGIYPSVIDEHDFYAAASKLESRKRLTVREACADHNLFTGLVRCAQCGHSLVRYSSRSKGKIYTYLFCTGRRRGLSDCPAKGIVYDQFEASFLSLITKADLMRRALAGPALKSKHDEVKGRLADIEKQANKIMRLIEDEDEPSKRLLERLRQLEVQEKDLREEADAEATKVAIQPLQAYDQLNVEFAGQLAEPKVRSHVRDSLRDFVERIEVDTARKLYTVRLKGTRQSIEVTFHKTGCCFSPAPLWAVDEGVYRVKAAGGEFTDRIP
jgi:DNA invertase Pin-like site-specific DNA recombinase